MKTVKIIAASLLCIFLGVCIFGIIRMRIKYPDPVEYVFSVGDVFTFGSYEITVKECEAWELNDFCENYNLTETYSYKLTDFSLNIHCYYVTVNITNIGEETAAPELYQMYVGTQTYTSGIDLEFFQVLNDGSVEKLCPVLQPGESVEVSLPYPIAGQNIGFDENDPFDFVPIELTVALYPEKYTVVLNDVD